MPNIYDLSKVIELTERERPVCVVILDTNVLMNNPSPEEWKVTAGPSIFVLSDSNILEVEMVKQNAKRDLRNKPQDISVKEKQETLTKTIEASRQMVDLCKRGVITDGIEIPGGWAISIPSPKQDELDAELKQIQDIVEAFGRYDSKYLLLTKECSQQLTEPVVFATGEITLFTIAQMNNFPCHLSKGFPMEVKEIYEEIKDWNQLLQDVQVTTVEHSIEVEVKLLALKAAPAWLGEGFETVNIAEGLGIMRDGTKNRTFSWTLPYREMILTHILDEAYEELPTIPLPTINLDFMGEDDFEQNIFDAIADRLTECASPDTEADSLTLQSPDSLMKMLIISEYKNEGKAQELIELISTIEYEDPDSLNAVWSAFTKDREDRALDIFEHFRDVMGRCWTINRKYWFRIMLNNLRDRTQL